MLPLQAFDPAADVRIVQRRLPHWSQAGTIAFLTWRTNDSIPVEVLHRWHEERREWLSRHLAPRDENVSRSETPIWSSSKWEAVLSQLNPRLRSEFLRIFSTRWHDHLDDCHGECLLRRPDLAQIIADSLRHFDGDRYELTDFVVMPNHVHVLAAFPDDETMLRQCDSWKHFTATKIHRCLGRSGRLWQQDGFDHLVRSDEQFVYLRGYFADNPRKARLRDGEFIHYSKPLPK
jgi:type I restriction enzyme R subunit